MRASVRFSSGVGHVYDHVNRQVHDPWRDHEVFWFGGALVVVRCPDGRIVVAVVSVDGHGGERRARATRSTRRVRRARARKRSR